MLTGSARPAPPTVHPLWTTPLTQDDSLQLHDRTAYVSRVTAGPAVELTAYDLAAGRRRWSAVSDSPTATYGINAVFDVVLGCRPTRKR